MLLTVLCDTITYIGEANDCNIYLKNESTLGQIAVAHTSARDSLCLTCGH